jgi:hypothetical protein
LSVIGIPLLVFVVTMELSSKWPLVRIVLPNAERREEFLCRGVWVLLVFQQHLPLSGPGPSHEETPRFSDRRIRPG